jgi:hypothetical protein
MLKIISSDNLQQINSVSTELLNLIKKNKFFFIGTYSELVRIKGSDMLIEITRALAPDYRFKSLETANENDLKALTILVNQLNELLLNKMKFTTCKLKDYTLDIKVKLCRELVSDLEDLFILGEINRSDIDDVYKTLSKPVPKKYSSNDLTDESRKIYTLIKSSIKDEAQEIKANSINHYAKMVDLIDPNYELITKKSFFLAGKKMISDIFSLRLCMFYKFDNDSFHKLINDEFDLLIKIAANNISNHCSTTNENSNIEVKDIRIGAKGFDIYITIDGQSLHARAIPVQGYFVRFHYRYIIT